MNLVKQLSKEGRSLYLSQLTTKTFQPNDRVLDRGDTISGAYFVSDGLLRVYAISEQGKEVTLYNIAPGETCILATNSLFNNFLYPAWVIADQQTTVSMISGDIYRELFRTEASIQNITIKALSSTVFGLMSELEQSHVQTVRQRLAGYLVMRSSSDFMIHATQQKIAADLGSSREFIARILAEFNELGIIRSMRGKILILDCSGLNSIRLAEDNV
ncbi:Crp/Fnr family transcriptional regulator [Oceanospirillum sediminis]|uniref:Crp/Fnr family transcriptional regulator n=1 Tax=Oceanospirillum sediminis TaxID=2760088 RepID=A0A839IT98_9GAMM|nr:Crp/Fnr family transcriptional regulator [Oceanospirillum sediminis]MBB1488683.1 Crp/Fnr family transcriptional regulator [Oceanospirillum sediminis]